VVNILLALRQAERTGQGCWLDIAMTDNVFCWLAWALTQGEATGNWPRRGKEPLTGGSPRYQIYETADKRYLAVAALEQRFWVNFCEAIGLPESWRNDLADPQGSVAAVAAIIASKPASQWERLFAGKDVCCAIVATLQEARNSPHFAERGLFERRVSFGAGELTALPVPVVPQLRRPETTLPFPTEPGSIDDLLQR
jgi:alpha-methylacyl-CoA racemase